MKTLIGDNKIVDYYGWCSTCKHKEESPFEDPCWSCIGTPARQDSRRPDKWEAKDDSSRI